MNDIYIFFKIIYFIATVITITLITLLIIFSIRVWKIVQYHYNKIKYEEEIIKEKIKEEKEESEPIEIIEEIEELEEPKTLKEKVNNFLFREDE